MKVLKELLIETYKEPELKLSEGERVEIEVKTFLGIPYGRSIKITID